MKAVRVRQMRNVVYTGIVERLLFTAIAVGVLLAAYGGFRYLDLSNQLAANPAAQIHQEGSEVELESKSEAHGLMAADIERRRLVAEQRDMMIAGGVGLALLGVGWLGYDILRGRRQKEVAAKVSLQSDSSGSA